MGGHARTHTRGGARALVICGLALYWPLLTLSKVALDTIAGDARVSNLVWLGFSAVLLVGAVALRWVAGVRRLVLGRWAVPCCGVATSALLLAGVLVPPAGVLGGILRVLACVLAAVTLCLLTVAWGEAALTVGAVGARASRPRLSFGGASFSGRLLVDVSLSLVLSFAIRLVTALAMGDDLHGSLGVACLVVYPALACVPWALYLRYLSGGGAGAGAGADVDARADEAAGAPAPLASAAAPVTSAPAGLPGRERTLLVAIAAFVALVSVLAGIRTAGTGLYPVDTSGTRYLIALAFSGALSVCTVLASGRPPVARAIAWGATVMLVFAGVLLTTAQAEGAGAVFGVNALLVARLVIWTLFWMLPVEAAWDARLEQDGAGGRDGAGRGVAVAASGAGAGTSAAFPGASATDLLATYYLVPQGIAYLLTDGLFIFWPALQDRTSGVPAVVTLLVGLALIACALLIAALLAIQGTRAASGAPGLASASAAGGAGRTAPEGAWRTPSADGPSLAPAAGAGAASPSARAGGAGPSSFLAHAAETAAPASFPVPAGAGVAPSSEPAPGLSPSLAAGGLGAVPGDLLDRRGAVCRAIAAEAGLTERETVVLEHLSLGHTVQRIAQAQGVTPNTVRTHSKGLYRKLDCHSKQEIIDLVDARLR